MKIRKTEKEIKIRKKRKHVSRASLRRASAKKSARGREFVMYIYIYIYIYTYIYIYIYTYTYVRVYIYIYIYIYIYTHTMRVCDRYVCVFDVSCWFLAFYCLFARKNKKTVSKVCRAVGSDFDLMFRVEEKNCRRKKRYGV